MQVGNNTEFVHCFTACCQPQRQQAKPAFSRSHQVVYMLQLLLTCITLGSLQSIKVYQANARISVYQQVCPAVRKEGIWAECILSPCRCSFAELVQETTPQPSGTSTSMPGRTALELECWHHQHAAMLGDPCSWQLVCMSRFSEGA